MKITYITCDNDANQHSRHIHDVNSMETSEAIKLCHAILKRNDVVLLNLVKNNEPLKIWSTLDNGRLRLIFEA